MLHGGHVKAVAAVAMSFAAAVGISTLAYPRVFRIACERAFDFVDEDSSGELDTSEIMTAVLMVRRCKYIFPNKQQQQQHTHLTHSIYPPFCLFNSCTLT
mmetsp:Transcript_12327/g.32778  ORF Transcript_12327/g.32778 Transcript_12327/m.32778 type:complete len:100 (-) Transcript_12327:362-661(-)